MAQSGGASPPKEAMRTGVSGAVVAVVAIVLLVAGLGIGYYVGKTTTSSSSSSNSNPYLVVGTNLPFPPFESYDPNNGTWSGFDIDFSQMFANATHRTLVMENYADFTQLLLVAGQGGVDMAASAITMSGSVGAQRNQTMSFSVPYYDANQAVLVKSSSTLTCPSSVCTAPNLENLTVGVQTGTTSESWVDDNLAQLMANPSNQIQRFTTVDLEVTALEAGSLDAVIIDQGPANAIAAGSSGALKVTGSIITGELYGFAVALGDPEHLLPVINSVITTAMQDGTYQKLITKWFK